MSRSKLPQLLIFVTVVIDLLGFGIVLPLLSRYGQAYQASPLMLGLLISAFSAMQFVFAPIWGSVSDRIGRRPVLLLGLLGSTVSYALFSYVSHFQTNEEWLGLSILSWLFVTRIGAGVAGATIPTAQAYIADITTTDERGRGMALIGIAFGIGFVFGPLIGAVSLSQNNGEPDWRPGAAAATLSGIAFLFALWKLPESRRPDSAAAGRRHVGLSGLAGLVGRRDLLLLVVSMFLTTLAFTQFEATLSLLTEKIGLSDRKNYLIFAYLGAVLLVAQGGPVRRLLPKWGEFRMATIGAILMVVGLPLVGFAGWNNSMWQLYVFLPLSVCGFAALNPALQSSLSLKSNDDEQGEVLGIGQSASAFARILGPLSGNYLLGMHLSYPYLAGGLLMVIGLLCVIVATRPRPTPVA